MSTNMSPDQMKAIFQSFGGNNSIYRDIGLALPERIIVGSGNRFLEYCNLIVNDQYAVPEHDWNIQIGNNNFFNRRSTIEAINRITIGSYNSFGPDVFVSDSSHIYNDFTLPVPFQKMATSNQVLIKDGTWLGAGVKVIGNVTIGYGCVVGANAVVTKSIPDHSLAAGIPAQIIKICDYRSGEWRLVLNNPVLLEEILANRGTFKGYDQNIITKILEVRRREKNEITKANAIKKAKILNKHKR